MMMPIIPHDKALHFIYGALIFCVGYLATFQWFQAPLWAAMALVALFAIGKEVADYWSNIQAIKQKVLPTHGVEVMDAIATVVGGAVVAIPLVMPKVLETIFTLVNSFFTLFPIIK